MSFFEELKRRNVFRVGVAYGVAGWVLLQVADLVLEAIEAPSWVLKALLLIVILGFVAALVIAWAYEMTPEGIRKENDVDRSQSITADTGRKMDRIIIAFLVLAVAVLLYRQIGLAPEEEPEPLASSTTEQATIDAGETDEPSSLKEINDKSIAVLPFTTRSTSEDDKFFSDGMHDDLLTQLAKIGSLKVISRTSMMEYRETTKNLKQIGLELGVANILEGAVQRVGKQVRINVQLIDTNTDEHLWAETYDREMSLDNLLSIQSEMSRSIAKAMEATLSPEEEALIERRLTDNLVALEAYRRAKALSEVFVRKDLERAELELKHALELDPDFAAAWAHLAYVYLSLFWGVDDQEHFRVSAREAIDQGRAIDPDLPELDIAEGYYFYWGHLDYQSALKILEPVLAIYPNDFELLELLAWVNRRYGEFDTALEFMFKALDVAPRDHRVLYGVGETYAAMRRFEEAQDYLIKLSEVGPANPRAAQLRGSILFGKGADYEGAARNFQLASIDLSFLEMNVWMSYVLAGDFESALAAVSIQADTTDSARRGYLDIRQTLAGMTLLYSGDSDGAHVALNEARGKLEAALELNPGDYQLNKGLCLTNGALGESIATSTSCDDAISTMPEDAYDHYLEVNQIAQGYALGGLQDKALESLEAALDAPVGPTAGEIAANPAFRSLHETSRWQDLMRKHGIQQ